MLFLYCRNDDDDDIPFEDTYVSITGHQPIVEISQAGPQELVKFDHSSLERHSINVKDRADVQLYGNMLIHTKGVPDTVQNQEKKPNEYTQLRDLFHFVSIIMRDLSYIDPGLTNSEIHQNRLGIDSSDTAFVTEQGMILYAIMKELETKDNLNLETVRTHLHPIIDAYNRNYGQARHSDDECVQPDIEIPSDNLDTSIDDCAEPGQMTSSDSSESDPDTSIDDSVLPGQMTSFDSSESDFSAEHLSEPQNQSQTEDATENLHFSTYLLSTESSGSESYDHNSLENTNDRNTTPESRNPTNPLMFSTSDIDSDCHDQSSSYASEENATIETQHNRQLPLLGSESSDIECQNQLSYSEISNESIISLESSNSDDQEEEDKNESNDENLEQFDYFFQNGQQSDEIEDDNFLSLANYKPFDRAIALNVGQIRIQIKQYVQKSNNSKKNHMSLGKRDILYHIRLQYINDYRQKNDSQTNASFNREWLAKIDSHPIIQEFKEQLDKMRKKPFSLTERTLRNWLTKFSDTSSQKAEESIKIYKNWGGKRYQKINDKVITTILCLLIDFPNFPAPIYTKYLNGSSGCCHQKPISLTTVKRIIRSMNFTVKKVAFSPPNRNTIGARIYRVAWSLFLDEISNDENVLLCFVDEAAVTTTQGRKYGRAFASVTPMINTPLINTKLSIVALVVPGFGVLYQFREQSIDNEFYADFLNSCYDFLVRYVCSPSVSLVFIEDNCKIHNTPAVTHVIKENDIALLPIVPYSPALNGVVEGYFGFQKMNHINEFNEQNPFELTKKIKLKWEQISDTRFTAGKSEALYAEWKTRLSQCGRGLPLTTGHVHRDQQNYMHHLTSKTVLRFAAPGTIKI